MGYGLCFARGVAQAIKFDMFLLILIMCRGPMSKLRNYRVLWCVFNPLSLSLSLSFFLSFFDDHHNDDE